MVYLYTIWPQQFEISAQSQVWRGLGNHLLEIFNWIVLRFDQVPRPEELRCRLCLSCLYWRTIWDSTDKLSYFKCENHNIWMSRKCLSHSSMKVMMLEHWVPCTDEIPHQILMHPIWIIQIAGDRSTNPMSPSLGVVHCWWRCYGQIHNDIPLLYKSWQIEGLAGTQVPVMTTMTWYSWYSPGWINGWDNIVTLDTLDIQGHPP